MTRAIAGSSGSGAGGPLARPLRLAALLAGGYLVLCSAYIVLSSRRAAEVAGSIGELQRYEQFKGLGFVAVSGLVFFCFSWWLLHRLARKEVALLQHRDALANAEGKVLSGTLAAAVAHDINNVLVVAYAGMDALRRSPEAERGVRAGAMGEALDKLKRLSQRLLALGRGGGDAERERLDFSRVVEDAVEFARRHPHAQRCRITTATERPLALLGDESSLQRMVINLVLNAAEATGPGGRIDVRLVSEGGEARLEVHDDGPGVPEERRPLIFEAFETSKPEGSGLGLFSVQRIAGLHRGRVEALSSELGGACFRVSLPLAGARPSHRPSAGGGGAEADP